MPDINHAQLKLQFHGRIIDHLGIQMYQSPVAAIAELISNAWDAEAEAVWISLPQTIDGAAEIVIKDNGNGMTFEDCQSRYLNIGYDRRANQPNAKSPVLDRPTLGRKGIGKFAGFGIACVINIETISKNSGEKTVFALDIRALRGTGTEYAQGPLTIDVSEYVGPDEERKDAHGTVIRLQNLTLSQRPSPTVFGKSMARRFLLHQRVANFKVFIDNNELPSSENMEKIEYVFPRDYKTSERPEGLAIAANGWGEEVVGGKTIQWKFIFYKEPIDEEDLRGISVFAHGKMAQLPFAFNIVGGISGQQGIEYLSGQLVADYIDELDTDIIATERQRVNWEHPETQPLLIWGQNRVKSLLKIWKALRAEDRVALLEEKLGPFNQRLEKFGRTERKVLIQALTKVASMSRLNENQFMELGQAIVTSWEDGRLKDLVDQLADCPDMEETEFIDILIEANVLTALHMAEAINTKLHIIKGLEQRIVDRQRENSIRDYVAENSWLISPQWETFLRERSIENVIKAIALSDGLDALPDWGGRLDLVLASGNQLVVLEFMRPGLTVDWDHLSRFERYILTIQGYYKTNTGQNYSEIQGYIVADHLADRPENIAKINTLKNAGMYAMDWNTLLSKAKAQWNDFLRVVQLRAPHDERLQAIEAPVEVAATSGEAAS